MIRCFYYVQNMMTLKALGADEHKETEEMILKKKMMLNIQFFAEPGGEPGAGGNGGQSGGAGDGDSSQNNAGGTYTYAQAEEIATARAARAETAALKSFFQQQGMSEAEVTQAIADYRQKKEQQKPNISEIENERDTAISKLQQYENEKVLFGMNVKQEDLDYVLFKVNQLVTDKKDFKTAAEEFLKENQKFAGAQNSYRVSTGTQSGNAHTETPNEQINNAIRNAFGRK